MDVAALRLRRAEAGDAALLAEFGARTFRETFAADNSPADMASYLAQSFGESVQRAELASSAVAAFIAEEAGSMIGYAVLKVGGESAGLVKGRQPVELHRLYVDAGQKGRGVAAALMAEVEREAVRRGGDTLWLGVWEKNPRAIAFYRKCGFATVGTHVFQLGSDSQVDHVMSKPLSSAIAALADGRAAE